MLMDQVDRMDLMDKMGAPRDNPGGCCADVWYGAGGNMPVGSAGSMATVARGRRGCGAC